MNKRTETALFAIEMYGFAAKENNLCETPVAIPCNKRYCKRQY